MHSGYEGLAKAPESSPLPVRAESVYKHPAFLATGGPMLRVLHCLPEIPNNGASHPQWSPSAITCSGTRLVWAPCLSQSLLFGTVSQKLICPQILKSGSTSGGKQMKTVNYSCVYISQQ